LREIALFQRFLRNAQMPVVNGIESAAQNADGAYNLLCDRFIALCFQSLPACQLRKLCPSMRGTVQTDRNFPR
jgi:hypothetical protein